MSKFLTGINQYLEEECRSAMINNNMDLSRLMVHVNQVEDSKRNSGALDVRRPRPQDQAGPSHGGHRKNFDVREQLKLMKGPHSSGNSSSKRSTKPRGGKS